MINIFLRLLSIAIVIGIGIPTLGCENFNKPSQKDYFMGVNMELPSDSTLKLNDLNHTIILLKGKNLSEGLESDPVFLKLQSDNLFSKIALAFISANAQLFKISNPANELTDISVNEDDLGFKHIRFQQVFNGIPVWVSEMNVHLDNLNNVYLVQGRYIPTPEKTDMNPVLKEAAVKRLVADNLGVPGSEYFKWPPELIIFSATDAEPCLAYRVVASLNETEGWAFIIDASTGAVLEKLPANYDSNSGLKNN
jgi:hypothetical protein